MKTALPHFTGRHDARSLALEILLDARRRDGFIQDLLDFHLAHTPLSPPDRRLTTNLAYGVLRRRGTLFALLRPHITREPSRVEGWLWDVLALGTFQLAFLRNIPAHA